jgi:polysaccharide biosynthesis/export protein
MIDFKRQSPLARRQTLVGALCGLATAIVLAATISLPVPASAESSGDLRTYQLEPGDRVLVTVFGQPELSGDLMVDGAGNILMPFIGAIEVKDLTVLNCQLLIRDRLANGVLRDPSVNVRISELRPLSILGDVRAPGTYAFRYGGTVLSAVAAAGGFAPVDAAAVSDFLSEEGRVRQLNLQRQALLVRQARLEAQLADKRDFAPPSFGPDEEKGVADIIANEKEALASQATMLQNRVDLLRSQKPRLESEIAALSSQVATSKKQLALTAQHAEDYSRLVKQGMGLSNEDMQLKIAQSNQENEVWRFTADVSRLEMDAGELDVRINDALASSKTQVESELRDVRERLRELDATLPSARALREAKMQRADNAGAADAGHSVKITRGVQGKASVIAATENTQLEPGDIIDVKKLSPNSLTQEGTSSGQPSAASYQVGEETPSGGSSGATAAAR